MNKIGKGRTQVTFVSQLLVVFFAAMMLPALAVNVAAQQSGTVENAIRPFRVNIPQKALIDLRRRIAATRWPDKETVADRSQGAQLAQLQQLVKYWGSSYDWRKADDVTLYWLTNSAVSSARIYWENHGRGLTSAAAQMTDQISIPVAITVFPDEVYRAPESWSRRAYRNLIYFHEADRGGHFAAWEYPELFATELRAAFKSLRTGFACCDSQAR